MLDERPNVVLGNWEWELAMNRSKNRVASFEGFWASSGGIETVIGCTSA